jgi:peptidyl-prolyl cis-trans isomerase D
MFRFFRKHQTVVMISLAGCIIGLLFFGIGSSSLLPSPQDKILKVNGRPVTQGQFDRLYNQIMRQKTGSTTAQDRQQAAKETLDELVRREVFAQEAQRYGLHVSDQELQMQIASVPAFQKDKQFDPRTYAQVVYQVFATTPREFEKSHRKDLESRKLNELIALAIHIPDDSYERELARRLASEKDSKALEKIKEKPETVREDMRAKEANLVFRDWLNQLNANLKVNVISDSFKKRMAGLS